MHVVDQKQVCFRIICEIALGDVLTIAGKVGKRNGPAVQDVQEARWPAAMLDVGLALGIDGGEKHAGLRRNEARKVRRDLSLKSAAFLHPRIGLARTFSLL